MFADRPAMPPLPPAAAAAPAPNARARKTPPPPAFDLAALPRFHPAVYQPPSASTRSAHHAHARKQASHTPRDALRHYRELVAGMTLAAIPSKPSKPRLHPTGSPGPVTPLALENEPADSAGYFASAPAGAAGARLPLDARPPPTLDQPAPQDRPAPRDADHRPSVKTGLRADAQQRR